MFGKKNLNGDLMLSKEIEDLANIAELGDNEDKAGTEHVAEPIDIAPADTFESLATPIIAKPSVLSQGCEFEGKIHSSGTLIISGHVIGSLTAKDITIENDGFVDGEIQADSLTVKGNALGEIRCRELTVGPIAKVDANSYFDTIQVQRGGKISGILNKS